MGLSGEKMGFVTTIIALTHATIGTCIMVLPVDAK